METLCYIYLPNKCPKGQVIVHFILTYTSLVTLVLTGIKSAMQDVNHLMEEAQKKSFRNVARRYGATLDNINTARTAANTTPRKPSKKRNKRKK